MNQIFTPSELAKKGIKKSDVARMMRSAERLVNWHAANYMLRGDNTPAQQAEWDAACAKWDHCKNTLRGMQ